MKRKEAGIACLEASLIIPLILGIILLCAAVSVALQEDRKAEDAIDAVVRSLETENSSFNPHSPRELLVELRGKMTTLLSSSSSPYYASVGFVTLEGDGRGYRVLERQQEIAGTFKPAGVTDDVSEALSYVTESLEESQAETRTLFVVRVMLDSTSSFSPAVLAQLGLPKSTSALRIVQMRNGAL